GRARVLYQCDAPARSEPVRRPPVRLPGDARGVRHGGDAGAAHRLRDGHDRHADGEPRDGGGDPDGHRVPPRHRHHRPQLALGQQPGEHAVTHRRAGFTILEMMIALVILAVIGGSLVRVLVSQTRLFEKASAQRDSRNVTRSAVNVIASDLRMVDAASGLVAASANTIVVRSPFAVGIVCGASGGGTAVSLAPADSAMWSGAGFSGYAWRDTPRAYNYVEAGAPLTPGGAATCAAAGVPTLPGGRVMTVTPAMRAGALIATPMLVEQRLRYQFKPSVLVPGANGLWRTVVATGVAEELAAPFTSAARFKFLVLNADSAQSAVPTPLADTRGIEFVLAARSTYTAGGGAAPDSTLVRTAVYFRNRLN